MGIGSLYQDKFEYENALINYKLASISNPNSALVWNNLGLCFFARQKYIAAVTCLKKANYLDPFEWIISYNLGLVYLSTNQFCSAFHYMNTASNYKSDFYLIYMYLGVILSQLGDIGNATAYYDKAIALNPNYLVYFNYAVSLINNDMYVNAREMFNSCIEYYNNYRDPSLEYDMEIFEGIRLMNEKLG